MGRPISQPPRTPSHFTRIFPSATSPQYNTRLTIPRYSGMHTQSSFAPTSPEVPTRRGDPLGRPISQPPRTPSHFTRIFPSATTPQYNTRLTIPRYSGLRAETRFHPTTTKLHRVGATRWVARSLNHREHRGHRVNSRASSPRPQRRAILVCTPKHPSTPPQQDYHRVGATRWVARKHYMLNTSNNTDSATMFSSRPVAICLHPCKRFGKQRIMWTSESQYHLVVHFCGKYSPVRQRRA